MHCDMNNFYASVEVLYHEAWRGRPLAVCGDKEARHGIVLAKSEEAKRCGVTTGEAIWQAKQKCRELIVVEPHFERYVKYSRLAQEIYGEYTDLVEPFGMDECWLDVSGSRLAFGDGVTIGNALRRRMKKELGLTISVGVSFNKIFAKLGSDLKKPDALTRIDREHFRETVWPLPIGELFGVGRKTGATLHRFGIDTIGALARADLYFLNLTFGKVGLMLHAFANGEDPSPVVPTQFASPIQSVGHGFTAPSDLTQYDQVRLLILSLCQEIGQKLRFHQMTARGIAVECKTASFCTRSLQKQFKAPTDATATLVKEAYALFCERYPFYEPLRALTVRAIGLEDAKSGIQLTLFSDTNEERNHRLDRACDAIRNRWGKTAVTPASLLPHPLPDQAEYTPFHAPIGLDISR